MDNENFLTISYDESDFATIPAGRFPVGIHMFKANNTNNIAMCGICSKLTVKTPLQYSYENF